MRQMERLASLEVIAMLDKLNNAKCVYEQATDEEIRQKADKTFADCYDWLVNEDIAITYDQKMHLWFFAGRY